ncbi:MAG: hypothetical protein WAN18_01400 [Candidatus Sulfotelmatobacter sp.]
MAHRVYPWQWRVENDWRDEQPERMLHEAHTGPLAILNYNPRSRYYGAATTSGFYPGLRAVVSYVEVEYQMSERHACRLEKNWRGRRDSNPRPLP